MALTRITKGVIKPNENYDTHNINSTGIVTAIGLDVNGNGDISGNLSVGGVLTYEDVTSIDSVGIITAQKDIHVGAGVSAVGVGTFGSLDIGGDIDVDGHTNLDNVSIAGVVTATDLTVEKSGNLSVNIKSTGGYGALEVGGTSTGYIDIKKPFSADYDLRLMHDGGNSYITSADKPLHFDAYSYKGINIGALGQTDLRYAGNVKLKTETGGVSVTGILTATSLDVSTDLDVDGHTNLDNVSIAGVTTFASNVGIAQSIFHYNDTDTTIGFPAANQVKITAGNEEVALFYNTGANINKKFNLRSSAVIDQEISESSATVPALRIRNTGNHTLVNFHNTNTKNTIIQWNNYVPNGAGNLIFRGFHPSNTEYARFTSSGNFNIAKDLDVDGHTNLDNVSISGVSTFSGNVIINDQIIHNGDTDTKLRFPSDNTFSIETAGGTRFGLNSSGNIELYGTQTGNNVALIYNGTGFLGFYASSNSGTNRDFRFFSSNDNNNEALRITSGGVVNIGGDYSQTSVSTQITGDLLVQKTASAYLNPNIDIYNYVNGGYAGSLTFSGKIGGSKYSQARIRAYGGSNTSDGSLAIETGNMGEKLRIDSSGRVLIGSTAKAGDSALQVYTSDKLHPAIRTNSPNANGYTMFSDAYTSGESQVNMGIAYSSASLVLSNGCKVNTSNDDAYVSSQGTYSTRPTVLRLDTDGSISFHNTASASTTPTDNAVTLTNRFHIDSSGNIGIGRNNPQCHVHIDGGTSGVQQLRVHNHSSIGSFSGNYGSEFRHATSGANHAMLIHCHENQDNRRTLDISSYDGIFASFTNGKFGLGTVGPDNKLHVVTNSSTAYSTSAVNTVNATNAILRLENTNGSDGSGVNNYVGMYFRVANGANSDAQLQYVRTGDNAGAFHFKARNSGTSYPNLVTMKSDGNMGVGVLEPKSKLHLGSTGDIRFGSQYGGFAHIMHQMQYAVGYTGTHWQFETNNQMSWCFDGVLIVYGGGGSTYGSEVTKITIVYSRENGANNSGDMWRNGTTSYNVETLGHGQVGLNPGAGELTVTEDTAPDGAASQRSLLKLGWTQPGHGGATTIWSKLHGTFYWGQGANGTVEIQDKDGTIVWNSNP